MEESYIPNPAAPVTPQPPYEPPVPQEEYDERFRKARHAYSASTLNLMLYGLIGQVLVLVAVMIAKLLNGGAELSENMTYLLNFVPTYLIVFPLYLLLSKTLEAKPPEQHSMNAGQFVISIIMCFAFMVVGAVLGNIVNMVFGAIFGFQIDSSALSSGIMGDSYLLLSLIATFGAPIVEEMLFRKVFIDRVRKYGDGTAILLSGILFGLFHGNFSQCFFAAGLGIFFGFIYVRTGKIQYTIAMHMTVNFLGSFVSGLILKGIDFEGMLNLLEKGDIQAIIKMLPDLAPLFIFEIFEYGLAIAGIVLLIVNRKKFKVAPPEVPLQKGTQFKAACLNLGFILLILFCLFLFVMTGLQLAGIIET